MNTTRQGQRRRQIGGHRVRFAIPVNTARAVAEQTIDQGYFTRPYLGIRYQSITPRIAAMYDLPVEWGGRVTTVPPGSPATR